jgi:hypothetical protein
MLWKVIVVVLCVAVAVGIVVEHAVTNTQIRTIADVRSSDTGGGSVALRGKIVFAKENTFVLQDATGRVELSTCPTWYKRIWMNEGDQVTVIGQVMNNPPMITRSEFVLSVYKILRGHEDIEVRERPGKPPWTSYGTREDFAGLAEH